MKQISTPPSEPLRPTLAFFKEEPDGPGLPPGWLHSGGRWNVRGGRAMQEDTRPGELSEARLTIPAPAFRLQFGLQTLSAEQRNPGAFGLLLLDGEGDEVFSLDFLPRTNAGHPAGQGTATGMAAAGSGESRREKALPLADDFASHALHIARLEVNGQTASLAIDGAPAWKGKLDALPASAVLFTRGMAAVFSAFELTVERQTP